MNRLFDVGGKQDDIFSSHWHETRMEFSLLYNHETWSVLAIMVEGTIFSDFVIVRLAVPA